MSMDDFEKLKTETESDLGRAIDGEEEHHLKALYYFGKGVALKSQLDAGPQRIGEILPVVMKDIETRTKRQERRQGRIVQAVKGFLAGGKKRSNQHRVEKPKTQGQLW